MRDKAGEEGRERDSVRERWRDRKRKIGRRKGEEVKDRSERAKER